MKNIILLLGATTTLAACAGSPQPPRIRPAPTIMQSYQCTNGERLSVNFFIPQGVAQVMRGGTTTDLNRTSNTPPTYRGGQTTLVADASRENVTLSVGMMTPLNCTSDLRPTHPIAPMPPAPPAPPSPPAGPSEIRTNFACDNGERLSLRRFPQQGIAVLERGGQSSELNRQPAPKGFHYSNGQTSVRGNGHTITVTVGMMAPMQCRAV